jgi:hypothetical protein
VEGPSGVWLVQALIVLGLGGVFLTEIDTDRIGRFDQTDLCNATQY